ncbi:MAG TPA: FAD:protein FMN transferase [Chitinophagaceae bacterium]|nr:FAD:protein FMN transferase [Chitinophagaceae bacterium]HPH31677.1 FAD:protein FMN transferase [Chitinophagaceae bacterium]HPN59120.1 FAD:protein FMN transferase [Chitinophagaceae bacterium]
MKRIIFSTVAIFLLAGCKSELLNTIQISGAAQGTTYHITYLAGQQSNYREAIDSIFKKIDLSLSTYQPGSVISKMNRNDTAVLADEYFSDVFAKSMEVSEKTKGLFDVTVAPVINAYGFGFTKKEKITQPLIDSLLRYIGYKKVRLADRKLVKELPQVMLDFNAIAQGYTVDVLSSFLESKGIRHYLVEVGGELRAKGKKGDDSDWIVGIEQPEENNADGASLNNLRVRIKDKSLATSGNYKKFYIENGKKYAHIINPFTGYPAMNNLLSATVIASDCMTADAYATAFMVMGLDKARQFLAENKNLGLEVLFIYDEKGISKTYMSKEFEANVDISH